MSSRADVRSVGRAPFLKFHMCMFGLSHIPRNLKV
jgi:hypothetical protein